MLTCTEKHQSIINNKINGNYTDAMTAVKKLTKKQLCEFMTVISCAHSEQIQTDIERRNFIVFIYDCVNS